MGCSKGSRLKGWIENSNALRWRLDQYYAAPLLKQSREKSRALEERRNVESDQITDPAALPYTLTHSESWSRFRVWWLAWAAVDRQDRQWASLRDRKSTRLNSSH